MGSRADSNRLAADIRSKTKAKVDVVYEGEHYKSPATAASDWSDWELTAPLYGGGRLALSGCTAGFTIIGADGKAYMLTAGHCAPSGTSSPVYGMGTGSSRGGYMGYILNSGYNRGGVSDVDVALITNGSGMSTFAARLYNGDWYSGSAMTHIPDDWTAAVPGGQDPRAGEYHNISGGRSGKSAYWTPSVDLFSTRYCDPDGVCTQVRNLRIFSHMNAKAGSGVARGDSGAPVWTHGPATVVGIQSGVGTSSCDGSSGNDLWGCHTAYVAPLSWIWKRYPGSRVANGI